MHFRSVTKFGIGGNRITELLANFLADEFKRKYRADPLETKRGAQKLHLNADNVKHILSTLVISFLNIKQSLRKVTNNLFRKQPIVTLNLYTRVSTSTRMLQGQDLTMN